MEGRFGRLIPRSPHTRFRAASADRGGTGVFRAPPGAGRSLLIVLLFRPYRVITVRPQLAGGLTFIMVTHDSSIARKAPRPATLRKGRITVKENAGA